MYQPAYENPRDGLKATQRRMVRVREIKRTMNIDQHQPNWYPTARLRNLELCDLYREQIKKGA